MKKTKTYCQHCGASMMMNYATMAIYIVRTLAKLVSNPGKSVREIGLSKVEYANVSKLKHFGLVYKSEEDGFWIPTEDGKRFLRGEVAVPRKIGYFRNQRRYSEGHIYVHEVLPSPESKQKYRDMMTPFLGEVYLGGK
jgi:hypothetical protein